MKIQNKKGFLLRDFVIVGVLFGTIISLYIIQVASLSNNYGDTSIINPSFASNYDKLTNQLNELEKSRVAVQGEQGISLVGAFDVAFNAVFTVVASVWQSILIYTGMAVNLPGDFPFLDAAPLTIVLSSAIAILTAYLIFVWISSVSRGKI